MLITTTSVCSIYHRYKTGSAIHNGLIAAYPRHPIIKRMLDYAMENVRLESYGDNDLDITGPIAMGKVMHSVNVYTA